MRISELVKETSAGVPPSRSRAGAMSAFGAMTAPPGVIELRRYTLHPGARETLIALFDAELIEPQEAVGMQVLAQFRDLDAPDSFVWLRGFEDMDGRRRGLEAFYGGPVWGRYADAANATMIDSDDVLLLRPAAPDGWSVTAGAIRPPAGAAKHSEGLFVLTTYHLHAGAADAFPALFSATIAPVFNAAGATILARLRSEHAPNDYPALPVREDAEVFVALAQFAGVDAHGRHVDKLDAVCRTPAIRDCLERGPETARLTPTERSALRA